MTLSEAERKARNERTVYVGDPDAYSLDDEMIECLTEDSLPLEKVFPEHFKRYLNLFFKYLPKKPVHVRNYYGGGFACVKRRDKGGVEVEQACYPDMIARHLDLERWQHNHSNVRFPDYHWVAMREPRKSSLKAIDYDNKDDVLGYYRTNVGRIVNRPLPILTVEHMQGIKRLHDAFPNHIWCVSSATLGLHIWEKFSRPQFLQAIDARDRPTLARIGIGNTEIHPMIGRAFRRPFGEDYFSITDHGLLEDWREQLDYFEGETATPSFAAVFTAMRELMAQEWSRYRGSFEPGRMRPNSKHSELTRRFFRMNRWMPELVDQVLENLDRWAAGGFDSSWKESTSQIKVPSAIRSLAPRSAGIWTCKFHGNWVQRCRDWAIQGLPAEDSMSFVVLHLARWFLHIEFFEDVDCIERTESILVEYCKTKSNGFISRLNQGLIHEVIGHVRRIVASANKPLEIKQTKVFEQIRTKRASNTFKCVYYFEELIRGPIQDCKSATSPSSVLFIECCTLSDGLEPEVPSFLPAKQYWRRRAEAWKYEPDDRPMPEALKAAILSYYTKKGLRIKKPTIVTISRFLRHLSAISEERRLSIQALKKIGFANDRSRRHLTHLEAMGIIRINGYCPAAAISKGFRLTDKGRKLLDDTPSTDS